MPEKRLLLLTTIYSLMATMAVLFGLVVQKSVVVTFVAFHLIVCLGMPLLQGYAEGQLKERWHEAWRKYFKSAEGVLVGLVSGMGLCLIAYVALWLLVRQGLDTERVRRILEMWGITSSWFWIFATYMTVVNSLLEEILWRGFILQRYSEILSSLQAIVVSSGFFALYHAIIGGVLFGWIWGLLITGAVFLVGMMWGKMKSGYDSIYPTWLSHLLADLGVMAALWAMIF